MNRIDQISSISDPEQRGDSYLELDEAIDDQQAAPLSKDEIQAVLRQISIDSEPGVYPHLWRFVLHQQPTSELANYAMDALNNPRAFGRQFALRYLREAFPEKGRSLFDQFQKDRDPGVKYEALLGILEFDPINTVFQIIDLLPHLEYGQAEEAEMYVLERGAPEHVERLRHNTRLLGGRPELSKLAAALEARLLKPKK